jgi:hypothetical protein
MFEADGTLVEDPILRQRNERDVEHAEEFARVVRRQRREFAAELAFPLPRRCVAAAEVYRPDAVDPGGHENLSPICVKNEG